MVSIILNGEKRYQKMEVKINEISKFIHDSIIEEKNPSGYIKVWDEITSGGNNKAIITNIDNGLITAIQISSIDLGKVIYINNRSLRMWRRTGRNFSVIGDILKSLQE